MIDVCGRIPSEKNLIIFYHQIIVMRIGNYEILIKCLYRYCLRV